MFCLKGAPCARHVTHSRTRTRRISQLCCGSAHWCCTQCSCFRLPPAHRDRCWRLMACLCTAALWAVPAHSAQLAKLRLQAWTSFPPERLQTLLTLEETKDVKRSSNLFCHLETTAQEFVAWCCTFSAPLLLCEVVDTLRAGWWQLPCHTAR